MDPSGDIRSPMNPFESSLKKPGESQIDTASARNRRSLMFGLKCAGATALVLAGIAFGVFTFLLPPMPHEELQQRIRLFTSGATRFTLCVFAVTYLGSAAVTRIRRGPANKA